MENIESEIILPVIQNTTAEVIDNPIEGGKSAFSTGGAFTMQNELQDKIDEVQNELEENKPSFLISSNETVNKFFKELYVVSTNEEYPIEELYLSTISRNKLASDGVRHYWGINFTRKGSSKPLFFLSYDNPESDDVLEFDLTEDGKSAKMYAVADWRAIEDESQFGTRGNVLLKYWDELKFSPYISAYIDSNTGSDNGDEPIRFIDSNNYSTVFKELYIDSFSSKIYHKEEGKNIDTYLEDIPLDKVDLQISRIQRKILSSSSGNYAWSVVFKIKLPVYETRDGINYIVRDENGEVQYTRSVDFFFSMYEEENGVIDKNISLSSVLREDNGEYRYYTYKMKLYAVIDWSQIEEGTLVNFYPRNVLDVAYEINNSPQIKEYIEEKESYLPIKVEAKATLNLTSSNRIMLYGASMCSNSYPWFKEWLEEYTGAEVFNAGNPGWSAKRVASTTYYDKVAQINPDVIYIMLGGNDKGDDVGTFGAISTQTLVEEIPLTESWSDAEANDKDYKFIQSLDYILRKLKSEYYDINDNPKDDKRFPYIVIGTFTPQHREGYSMIEYNDPQNWLNKRNAIVECANKNNLPCIDVFSEIGIDWDKEPYYNQDLDYVNGKPTLVNRGIYTLDGLHLNEYGFERLARLVSGVFVPSNSKFNSENQFYKYIEDAEADSIIKELYFGDVKLNDNIISGINIKEKLKLIRIDRNYEDSDAINKWQLVFAFEDKHAYISTDNNPEDKLVWSGRTTFTTNGDKYSMTIYAIIDWTLLDQSDRLSFDATLSDNCFKLYNSNNIYTHIEIQKLREEIIL